jgi:predicted MFS family arabinose efflux permease
VTPRRLAPALAAGLVLADSSIVTLALPEILRELHLTVAEVAWVLVSFNVALAVAAVPGAQLAHRSPRIGFAAGAGVFAAACLLCAVSDGLGLLLTGRVVQGIAGAVVLAASLELLLQADPRRALGTWATAGVLGAAIGPAAGGLLTDALSWEAMFALQAPVALLALSGLVGLPAPAPAPFAPPLPGGARRPQPRIAALAALALASAALAAALFLLVTMVIEGWRHSPAQAAAIVTVMPLSAVLAGWVARQVGVEDVVPRAAAGAVLLAGGLAGLGLLPSSSPAWTIAPQVLVGLGLGLLVTSLTRLAVPAGGATAHDASLTILARHAGVVVGLLLLTPVFTADLDAQQQPTEMAALSELLDAPLPLTVKVRLATSLGDIVERADGRIPDLEPAFAKARAGPGREAAMRELRARMDAELDRAGTKAFSRSFLAAAGFALLALVPIALLARREPA